MAGGSGHREALVRPGGASQVSGERQAFCKVLTQRLKFIPQEKPNHSLSTARMEWIPFSITSPQIRLSAMLCLTERDRLAF